MKATLIDKMGSDLTVVNAARVSFAKNKAEFDTEGDTKLINYLAKHNHWTPFGHCSVQFHVKAPIFVARQLVKHQVGLVWNEVSRRYVDDTPEFYFPEQWRMRPDASIKQGSGNNAVPKMNEDVDHATRLLCDAAARAYDQFIDLGIAPEQARMVLPQNMFTEWYWTGSLHAFARVCKLRLDPHAQLETRMVAEDIDAAMRDAFPVSWKALMGDTHA